MEGWHSAVQIGRIREVDTCLRRNPDLSVDSVAGPVSDIYPARDVFLSWSVVCWLRRAKEVGVDAGGTVLTGGVDAGGYVGIARTPLCVRLCPRRCTVLTGWG
jgi:hypothetical protein